MAYIPSFQERQLETTEYSYVESAIFVSFYSSPVLCRFKAGDVIRELTPAAGSLCGWDPRTGDFNTEINAQIAQAFSNVDLCLKDAGGQGWSQVFRINSYHVPVNNEAINAMTREMKKWMPDHQPLWTCVGVQRLGEDDMRVEIEVVAHDPEGAGKNP
ncbi:hypothetical protein LTR64_008627 [Lithohypha guttulata]|uniref:uncharacterized protein n=1 Tax=Lithohypha guttulata TaxID=1690604 RepID=UPI002DDDE233|nr:hypothetical protein LTR51_008765 [Lithohypha guttulata]